MIKPRRTEDAPRAAVAARKPVVPASSVQQKPARRDVAKPSGGGAAPKKHSPSVPASGPGARYKGGKKVLYVITYCIHATSIHTHTQSLFGSDVIWRFDEFKILPLVIKSSNILLTNNSMYNMLVHKLL